jgi:hypothetical protein
LLSVFAGGMRDSSAATAQHACASAFGSSVNPAGEQTYSYANTCSIAYSIAWAGRKGQS